MYISSSLIPWPRDDRINVANLTITSNHMLVETRILVSEAYNINQAYSISENLAIIIQTYNVTNNNFHND